MPHRFLFSAVIIAFFAAVALPSPVLAQMPAAPQAGSPIPQTAADFYTEGTNLLTRGKYFAQAVADLEQAVKSEPTNSDYILALGAAYTSRAAVLARAILAAKKYEADTVRYKAGKTKWIAAQKNPRSPAYGYPKPEPIAPPRTTDDNRLFKMEISDAEAQVKTLSLQAWQTLDTGVALRENDEVSRRAEALNLLGWCRILLYLDAQYAVKESWPPSQTGANGIQKNVSLADAKKNKYALLFGPLEEAAAFEPSNPVYLRSLGDAYAFMGGNPHSMNPLWRTKGADILTQVLEKTPRDGLLALRINQLRGMHLISSGPNRGPVSLVTIVKNAVDSDPSNAFLWYCLFAAAGEEHDYQTAMMALKSAETAPDFRMVRYASAVPKTLRWAFPPLPISGRRLALGGVKHIASLVFADKNNPTSDAPLFLHGILVMAHRFKAAWEKAKQAKQPDDEKELLEVNTFVSAGWAVGLAKSQASVPQSETDKQLFTEAQNYLTKNDADYAAEDAMGTHNLHP